MNKELESVEFQGIIRLFREAKEEALLEELFELFLTMEEIEMLKARYRIVQELLKGKMAQREIAKQCNVSIAQITRGSNFLKTISPELETFLQTHLKEGEKL